MLAERGPSTEHEVAVATSTAAAFGRAFTYGEIGQFLALLAPDVEFEVPSVMASTVKKLSGHDGVRGYLEETEREYKKLVVDPKEIRDLGGGRFMIVGSWRATPRGNATTFGTPMAAVLDIDEGKVARVRAFFDEGLAVAAAAAD